MDPAPADSLSEEVVPDSTPESQQPSPDSEMVPDSIEVVPDSIEMVPDLEMVPDSLPTGAFICGRCHLVHEDRESWNRAHSRFYPCSRCGLVHCDYDVFAFLHGLKDFDCKLFIPDVNNIMMEGNWWIVLPPQVLKMIDEKKRELDAKKKQDVEQQH